MGISHSCPAQVFVADGCSGAAPAFERLDDDGEDDDASWALAFAGEALLAVSPAFRCTVFRRERGAWTAAAHLDWSAAAAGAPRGFRPEPRLAAAGGVVALAGAKSVDVFRAADFRDPSTPPAAARAGKESEIPNFKGSYLGRFPLVSADFWTSDHLSERSRRVDAFSGTRARGTLMLKRT